MKNIIEKIIQWVGSSVKKDLKKKFLVTMVWQLFHYDMRMTFWL